MNMYQLGMLIATVENGGFRQAARKLFISHSAIHRQLRMLEDEVGGPLLVRSEGRLHPTEAGEVLIELGRSVSDQIKGAQRHIEELSTTERGRLRLGTGGTLLVFLLLPILRSFRSLHRAADVYVMSGNSEPILTEVHAGNIDLAVMLHEAEFETPASKLSWAPLGTEEYVFVVSKGHPLIKKRSVKPADLQRFPFIAPLGNAGPRQEFDRFCAETGLTLSSIMECDNQEAIEHAVEGSDGIGYVSKSRAIAHRRPILKMPGHTISCEMGFVYRKSRYLPALAREFMAFCRKHVNKDK